MCIYIYMYTYYVYYHPLKLGIVSCQLSVANCQLPCLLTGGFRCPTSSLYPMAGGAYFGLHATVGVLCESQIWALSGLPTFFPS